MAHKNLLKIFAVIASVVIVIAGAGYAIQIYGHRTAPAHRYMPIGSFGPKVTVGVASPSAAVANNTTINVQIFSPVPDAFARGGLLFYSIPADNQWNNSVNDELLNATLFPGNNTTAFFMSPQFDAIAHQWVSVLSGDSGINYPSLSVYAVKTVVSNGSALLYTYYNNLLYNPFNLSVVGANSTLIRSGDVAGWFNGSGINPAQYSQIYVADLNFYLTPVFSSTPSEIVSLNSSSSAVAAISTHSSPDYGQYIIDPEACSYFYSYSYPTSTSSNLVKTTYANGTLPLIGVHIGRNADQGKSQISMTASIFIQNDSINFNSNTVYSNPSGSIRTAMSTNPSFAHIANVTTAASTNSTVAEPESVAERLGANFSVAQNKTTAIVGIQGIEYEFQHYNTYTYKYKDTWLHECCFINGGVYCYPPRLVSQELISKTYDGNYTTGEIIHVNSTAGIKVEASSVSIWEAWVIQHFLLQDSNGTLTLNSSGRGTGYQASDIWAHTYGWSNAANAYGEASKALSTFSTALSLGLAVIATLAATNIIDLDASEAAVIAAAGALVAKTISLAATVLKQFSSISFISGAQSIQVVYGFSNYVPGSTGSNYSMQFYESASPVTFTLPSGSSYFFYAPVNYLNATAIV